MRPPRYATTETELEALVLEVKRWACPHCRQFGRLNSHGRLRGLAEAGPGKATVRGRRFFCSNRGRRDGCGRTFSVWLASVLAGFTVRSGRLWRFLARRSEAAGVLRAWVGARSGFSLEAAYRWWRQWRRGECALRTRLWRGREPPDSTLGLTAACAARYGAVDPIAAFQGREQTGWPGFGS
jgi:hypothetical protein